LRAGTRGTGAPTEETAAGLELPPLARAALSVDGTEEIMHSIAAGMFALLIALAAPSAAVGGSGGARSSKAQCKEIQKAVSAGQTMEQIMAAFRIDAAHVMKCLQKRGKKKKKQQKPSKKAKRPASRNGNPRMIYAAPETSKVMDRRAGASPLDPSRGGMAGPWAKHRN